ncbi:hypothetical protein MKK55_28935 [Methylobacterium sp. J-059]|uniref:hypothetical protein n=1 Tax=Methylobacterium sp. J-059 TaxID=2836643 RepID=UPI001FBC0435|nr:hypothetical protein [Methylobacterium sp. J-059]MCJ2042943.1 hypothetical protein [Methylobacterium sp. J-059]
MPTALPISAGPRLTLQQSARFGWLMMRERYLMRRLQRAARRQDRVGVDRGGGRLLHFTRRWLACHAEIAALLGEPEREDAAAVRATLAGCIK